MKRRLKAVFSVILLYVLAACPGSSPASGAETTPKPSGLRALNLGAQTPVITLTSGNNNDVAIRGATGNTTTMIQFAVNSSDSTLTGMSASTIEDGDLFFVRNNSSTGNLILTNNDSLSVAANRFLTANGASLIIPPRSGVLVEYDKTLGWTIPVAVAGSPTFTEPKFSGKLRANGTGIPVLSSCGSTPSPSIVAGSTDAVGKYTTGGTATTCTVTFASTWGTAPSCVVTPEGSATQPTYTTSATAITVSVDIAQTTYNYICIGR